IIRACKELGLETVQIYSEADRETLPVRIAERALCIGGVRSSESYLNAEAIVSAARTQRADAIHPGYGFLAENAAFASLCEREGGVRRRLDLRRKISRRRAAHRSANPLRWRNGAAPGRARLLDPAAQSEARRGKSVPNRRRDAARRARRRGGAVVPARPLQECRH